MSYNKALITDRQTKVVKSIGELLDVLNDIPLDEGTGQSDTMICDDGTEMALGFKIEEDKMIDLVTIRKGVLNLRIVRERKTHK